MSSTRRQTNEYRLGRRIQKIRKQTGLTQEQLAEKLRVSTTWIGYIETGYRRPNLTMILRIAKALGVKARDVLPF